MCDKGDQAGQYLWKSGKHSLAMSLGLWHYTALVFCSFVLEQKSLIEGAFFGVCSSGSSPEPDL